MEKDKKIFHETEEEKNNVRNIQNMMKEPLNVFSLEAPMTDPNGSYTGVPINPFEEPVQDADDL